VQKKPISCVAHITHLCAALDGPRQNQVRYELLCALPLGRQRVHKEEARKLPQAAVCVGSEWDNMHGLALPGPRLLENIACIRYTYDKSIMYLTTKRQPPRTSHG
jgi:hypothetical protein